MMEKTMKGRREDFFLGGLVLSRKVLQIIEKKKKNERESGEESGRRITSGSRLG